MSSQRVCRPWHRNYIPGGRLCKKIRIIDIVVQAQFGMCIGTAEDCSRVCPSIDLALGCDRKRVVIKCATGLGGGRAGVCSSSIYCERMIYGGFNEQPHGDHVAYEWSRKSRAKNQAKPWNTHEIFHSMGYGATDSHHRDSAASSQATSYQSIISSTDLRPNQEERPVRRAVCLSADAKNARSGVP